MEDPSLPPGILRTCTSCGSPIGTGQKFCEICGTKAEALPVCRKCGALFIAPVKFCELCGTPVAPEGSGQGIADEPTATVTEPHRWDEPGTPEPEPRVVPEPEPVEPGPEETGAVHTPLTTNSSPRPSDNALFLPDEELPAGTGKPPSKSTFQNKALIAGGIVVVLIVIAALFFIGLPLLQGSGIASAGAAPSPVNAPLPEETTLPATMPTMTPTPVPTIRVDPLLTQPTEVMPKNQEVYFRVEKDQVTAKISVLYQNGPGVNVFKSAEVRVTHPDGSVDTETLVPSKSMEVFLDGSKGNDRIEVIATMYTGLSYRIKDEILTFKGH